MQRNALLLAALFAAFPALGQQMTCTASAGSQPTIRSAGFTEIVGDLILTCSGGTPTANGVLVPRYDIVLLFNTTVTSRLVAGDSVTEALLLVDEPNSPLNPARPLLNCGAPLAPDDTAGNGGPTGTSPGVCGIRATANPAATYDGTNGTAGTWGTGRPNVFQGTMFSTNIMIFPGVPIDPPANGATRRLRITGLRANAQGVVAIAGSSVTVTVSGSFATINSPQQTLANLGAAGLAPVNSPNGSGVNTVRFREGFAAAFKPRNFASYYVNPPSAPGNGGDYGINLATVYGQNVSSAIYLSEEAFNSAGRTTPPGGNPNGTPPPANGLTFASGNATAGGTFSSGAALNTGLSGLNTNGGRVAFVLTNLVSGYTVKAPASVRLTQAGTATPTGIAQLVTGSNESWGGTVSTDRSTATLVDIPVASGTALVVYEIVYTEPSQIEDLTVPITLTRAQAAGANPSQAPRVFTGMAPYSALPGVSRARADADFPSPRFVVPFESAALNLGALGFETTSLPGGATNVAYSQTVVARGGTPLYAFDLFSGALPPGLTLNAATGVISGSPTTVGNYSFTVRVTDAAAVTATQPLSISITAPISLVSPANGATNQPLRPRLTWTAVGGATQYNVYLGTAATPPLYRTVTTTFFDPMALPASTQHFWRVEAVTSGGNLTTATWSFTTVVDCATSVNTGPKFFTTAGGSAIINVTAPGGCAWTATSDSAWATLTPSAGTGNQSFTVTVPANTGPARMALITVGRLNFRVMQAGNPAVPVFDDVPSSSPYFDYISLMYSNTITAGCSLTPFLYCPQNPVTREQMAVFVVRSLTAVLGTPLDFNPVPYFNDMPNTSNFFPWVQRMRDTNITAGCSVSPPLYCPFNGIPQEQMAVFMIKAWLLATGQSTFTYTQTPYFTDVPNTSIYFPFIQKMKDLGFWNGCGNGQYCPSAVVTRGEMSALIMRSIFLAP